MGRIRVFPALSLAFTYYLYLTSFITTAKAFSMSDATSASTSPYFASTEAAGTTVEVTFGGSSSSSSSSQKKLALGYWSIRGLGAPLTMMLFAAKVPFTLFLYDIVEEGESGSGWTSDYFAAKEGYIAEYAQPLWNLPFCINREERMVICQTNAIFAYVGRECGMLGDDEASTSQCEQLLCEIYDLRNAMVKFAYATDGGDEAASDTLSQATKYLKKLEAWLEIQSANDGNDSAAAVVHLVNGKFSAPDFHLFEMLDQFEALCHSKDCLDDDLYGDFPRLKAFKNGFAALEENKYYLESWLHKELPFNNCMAKFGSLPGPKTYTHGESAKEATWRQKGVIEMSP